MSHEGLIYRMTKIVYQRLGPEADVRLVEDLVTELARAVGEENDLSPAGGSRGASRVVVSVFGTSRPGIVAAIASRLADSEYNIVDVNQTVVQGKFAMVLIAEAAANATDLSGLRRALVSVAEPMGVQVYIQREDLFQALHRV